jgi:hypothetical protein
MLMPFADHMHSMSIAKRLFIVHTMWHNDIWLFGQLQWREACRMT